MKEIQRIQFFIITGAPRFSRGHVAALARLCFRGSYDSGGRVGLLIEGGVLIWRTIKTPERESSLIRPNCF